MERANSFKVVIEKDITIRQGQGHIDFKAEWTGRVVPEVYEKLIASGKARDASADASDVQADAADAGAEDASGEV